MKHNACLAAAMGLAALFLGPRSGEAQVFDPGSYVSNGALSVGSGTFAIDTDALTYNGAAGGLLVGNTAVFDFDSIAIASGATVTVVGSHPLALLSRSGFVLAQGAVINANAGGYGAGDGPGAGAAGSFGPGGGGGFGGPGGRFSGQYYGGSPYGDLLVKLEGGSGGGTGSGSRDHTTGVYYAGGAGGAGGGAIEISATGAVTLAGRIDASGQSGQYGASGFTISGAGGGGGAGGGILIAGASVTLTDSGVIRAEAGSGSSGGLQSVNDGGGGRISIQTPSLAAFVSSGNVDVRDFFNSNQDGVVSVNGASGSVSGKVNFEGVGSNYGYNITQKATFDFRDASDNPLFTRALQVIPALFYQNFQIYGVPAGTYHVRVKGERNLAVIVTVTSGGGAVTGVSVTLPGGDANNDNIVDTSDFGLLVGTYGSSFYVPGSGYDSTADFNDDGLVDTTDFGILVGNYGASGAL